TFRYHYRMNRTSFNKLCSLLKQHPAFQHTAHNDTLIEQQVGRALWRSSGCHLGHMMQKSFLGFGQGLYANFTNRFLEAITGITSQVIHWPTTIEEVQQASYDFEYPEGEFTEPGKKKMPGCIGIVDGKLINIHRPASNPESYRDRKGNISLN
ncbi:hypothetical protein F4703DRAFT_1716568, partial [Phycomyces blakesleeanus]